MSMSLKLVRWIVFIILVLTVPSSALAQRGGLRYTIGVAEFTNKANWEGQYDLGHDLGVVLTALLDQSERFIVVGEAAMRGLALEEQDLASSGRAAGGAKAPVTGHLTPAQLLVKGAITHVQYDTAKSSGGTRVGRIQFGGKRRKAEINVTFYIIDTSTGQTMGSKSVVATSKSRGFLIKYKSGDKETDLGSQRDDNLMTALTNASAEAITWMTNRLDGLPWQGSVVQIEGQEVYINRGAREGIVKGQSLVVGPLKQLRDPGTGEILGQILKEEVARVEVEMVQERFSICKVLSGDVKAIRQGLPVTLPGS